MKAPAALLLLAAATAAMGWICQVDPAICNGCGMCIPWCPLGAISMSGPDAVIDPEICDGCGICIDHCPRRAIYRVWQESSGEGAAGLPGPAVTPNPSSGTALVEGLLPGTEVRVYDASGRLVIAVAAVRSYVQLDLWSCAPGPYVVCAGSVSSVLVLL